MHLMCDCAFTVYLRRVHDFCMSEIVLSVVTVANACPRDVHTNSLNHLNSHSRVTSSARLCLLSSCSYFEFQICAVKDVGVYISSSTNDALYTPLARSRTCSSLLLVQTPSLYYIYFSFSMRMEFFQIIYDNDQDPTSPLFHKPKIGFLRQ